MRKQNSIHSQKTLFITFEGVEGAGKSTLMKALYEFLKSKNIPVIQTHEPGGTPLGKQLRELLLHRGKTTISKKAEIFLFLADRANHVKEIIIPALKQGTVVLCDRYTDSTIAYQGNEKIDDTQLEELCHFATDNLQPNITFLLDIDPSLSLARLPHRDHFENKEISFHQEIRKKFLKLASIYKKRFVILDARLPMTQVLQRAIDRIQETIQYV